MAASVRPPDLSEALLALERTAAPNVRMSDSGFLAALAGLAIQPMRCSG